MIEKKLTARLVYNWVAMILMLLSLSANAQTTVTLTLDSCYSLAKRNYPLIKQFDLIEQTREFTVENANKGYLPQLHVNGQATYQSQTIEIPISVPGFTFPQYSNEQYKIYAEADQTIYDGGVIKQQALADEANADVQQQNLEVQLYALRDRINQMFFGILLANEQVAENEIAQKDIQSSIDKMQAALNNGMAYKSNVDELQAELLSQQQNNITLKASRKAYLDMLSIFINKPLDENTILQIPQNALLSDEIHRPELALYDVQEKSYDVQNKILSANNRPKFSLFLQGDYGRPTLNTFSNNFGFYYIGGIALNWSLSGFYTLKNSRQILNIDKLSLDAEKETFLFNTNLTLKEQSADIEKLQALISSDSEIIAKRASVTSATKAQMENGIVTSHEYVNELDDEEQAKQNLLLHQVQLLMTEYDYQNATGN